MWALVAVILMPATVPAVGAERLVGRLKQSCRIATRYERLAVNCLPMLHIATIRLWLQP